MTNSEPQKIKIEGWTFRVKKPGQQTDRDRLLLLLHGHLGDENAMWILTQPIPRTYTILAPRAPVQTGANGFSWHEITTTWPSLDFYKDLGEQLMTRVSKWLQEQHLKVNQIDVMGFSQGASMAYALTLLYPEKIGKVAALAGFLPASWRMASNQNVLKNREFFVAHGNQDAIIPIKYAYEAVSWLKEKGAQVTFCEADIGHKISAGCFNGLGEFFTE